MEILGHSVKLFLVPGFVCILYGLWCISEIIKVAFDRDLRRIPGPFLSRFTTLSLKLAVLGGKRSLYIHDLHEKYGPYVRIAPQEIAIADIEAWRKIHRIGSDFHKAPWYQQQTPFQYSDDTSGVFCIRNNKVASHRRRLFQSANTKDVLVEWEPQVAQLVNMTVQQIKRELKTEGRADVMKWWTLMTSDVLSTLAFGQCFNNVQMGQKSELIHDVEMAMLYVGVNIEMHWLMQLMMAMPPSLLGRFAPPFDRFTKYGNIAVENTRNAIKGANKTLFSKMFKGEDSDQTAQDTLVAQEAANVIVAGTDTTAMSLAYLVYSVLKNDSIKTKLVEEVNQFSENPEWTDMENMPYLNMVIQETLRLHPAVPGSLPRVVPSGGETLGGYVLPGGTVVSTQAYTFHHDPNVFPDPFKFDPDRWTNPTSAMKEHLMAFGGPARYCLGVNIARMELLHAVFRLFRDCADIEVSSKMTDENMEFVDYFTIKPKAGFCEIVRAQ